MFNWTTTTILNSLTDYTTDLPLVTLWDGAKTVDAEGNEFPADPKVAGISGPYPTLRIKRDHTFEARYISSVYKAIANTPVLCEMEIDCAAIIKGLEKEFEKHDTVHGRLSFYVALEGSEESIYANDWYQKGKPFSIGFEVSAPAKDAEAAAAEKLAENLVKNANKFGVVIYGKKIFDLKADGTTLKLKGTHEYQRIKVAAVVIDHHIDELLVDSYEDGVDCLEEGTATAKGVFTLVKRGINGFGTYHQLVKDLRLPTAHHNKWLQIKEDEKPVVGAKYNQYIITYCAPSMANPGFTVIGLHNMSVTTHVFWVNQAIDDEFNNLLKEVANIQVVNKVTSEGGKDVTTKVGAIDTKVELLDSEGNVIENKQTKKTAGVDYSVNHEQKVVHTESDAEAGKTAKGSK